jgi:bifunctional aspartokinase / homoserine dehydrogenase 1
MTVSQANHSNRVNQARRPEHFSHPRHARAAGKRPLQVMKFGGTSVGDPSCIRRVVEIVRAASEAADIVVVVSAMSGVTNQLVKAASLSEAGKTDAVAEIFAELRRRHTQAANELLHSASERNQVEQNLERLFQAGERLCQGTTLLRELTPRSRDVISSLGERLSILLVAAALREHGIASEAIEATELISTNGAHGAADPCMNTTRQLCTARLRPLLQECTIPVITGFIGATSDGVLTTFGRGGSDYSATIIGSALDADEVVIWTDVDGMQTADPKLVSTARTISEISYREAAELAYFGAKVLHPKTLRPVMQRGIPLWIKNTFAADHAGTKITCAGARGEAGMRALTALSDVALIMIDGALLAGQHDVLSRALQATASARAEILLVSQASAQNSVCLAVPSASLQAVLAALHEEFSSYTSGAVDPVIRHSEAATVTIVGDGLHSIPTLMNSIFNILSRERINVLAVAQGCTDCALSVVIARKDASAAVAAIHQEFRLGEPFLDRSSSPEVFPLQVTQ